MGITPMQIEMMVNLENLYLYNNYFTRYITIELGELELLLCLLLNGNRLDGVSPYGVGEAEFPGKPCFQP